MDQIIFALLHKFLKSCVQDAGECFCIKFGTQSSFMRVNFVGLEYTLLFVCMSGLKCTISRFSLVYKLNQVCTSPNQVEQPGTDFYDPVSGNILDGSEKKVLGACLSMRTYCAIPTRSYQTSNTLV